jgi:transposase
MELTDAQWDVLAPLLPRPRVRRDRRGRPWRDPRDVLNGILWILRTGAPWKDLPDRYPSYQTCHRRFQHWVESGTMERVLQALARDLEARGGLNLSECFIDGTFAGAKKGALWSGKHAGARGPRSWPSQTALVFLSPYASAVLRRMKSPSSVLPSTPSSPLPPRSG